MAREIYIGTSGWQSGDFVRKFYPTEIVSAHRLEHYSSKFNSVEINSSFRNFSRPSTYQKRYIETGKDFKFSIKAHRLFTHDHPLSDPEKLWAKFFEPILELKEKLGVVLFQFPPSFEIDIKLLKQWLKYLRPGYKYAFEFRNASWHQPKTYRILEKFNAAFCNYDFRGTVSPIIVTASWSYIRLHGPLKKPYRGHYSLDDLNFWQKQIKYKELKDVDVFLYFDNTMTVSAIENALKLKKQLA